jgi:transforming growth factor-beta-induced protein
MTPGTSGAPTSNALRGHVLAVPQDAESISIFANVLEINAASWDVVVDGETLRIGPATVVTADIEADNGIIHAIDAVLLPPPPAES